MGRMSDEAIGLEDEGKAPWQLDPLHPDNWIIDGPPEDDETDSTSDDVESKNSEDVTDECPF